MPLGVDVDAARELELYIDNDRRFSPQSPKGQGRAVALNLLRKMRRGTYDHSKAPRAWQYVVDNAARAYVREFGGDLRTIFPATTRRYVAYEMANEFASAAERGEYVHLLERRR